MQEAKHVSIEIDKLNWELIDLTYRFEWDDPAWLSAEKTIKPEEVVKRKKAVEDWLQKKKQYLSSIKRRIKFEGLMGRVVAKDHLGRVPFRVIYDTEPVAGLDVNYKVLSTIPAGDVRVGEDTELELQESVSAW